MKWTTGQRVRYWPAGAEEAEEGVVTSWNYELVFVRFGGDASSKGCRPDDLELPREEWVPARYLLDTGETGACGRRKS